ncbi:MAG: hypothetical protein ACI38Y_02410, partial [Candidatus Methanomethylophilaceae archaeon]
MDLYKTRKKVPGPKAEEWLRAHLDEHGTPCDPVECKEYRPDISELSKEQQSYYLYWRDRILNGECVEFNRNYTYVFLSELIIRDPDPSEVKKMCLMLDRNSSLIDWIIADFLFDYQITHGIDPDYPFFSHSYDGDHRTYGALSNLMTYPQSDIPPFLLRKISSDADIFFREGIEDIVPDFGKALRAVGDLLEKRDSSILEEYGDGRRIMVKEVFTEYPTYHGERHYVLDYTEMDMNGRMGRFLLGLFRQVIK